MSLCVIVGEWNIVNFNGVYVCVTVVEVAKVEVTVFEVLISFQMIELIEDRHALSFCN